MNKPLNPHGLAGSQESAACLSRVGALFMALLLISVSIYCRLRLLDVPLERDEGGFAYIAQKMLDGITPYESAYTMKLPGIHAMYALSMGLFGETPVGIHLGLLLISILNMACLFLLAHRFTTLEGAAVSVGIYALLSVSQEVFGVFAHATHYVSAFALAGTELYFRWRDSRRLILIGLSGISLGLSVIMKQNGVFFAGLVLVMLAMEMHRRRDLRRAVPTFLLWLAGLILPYAAVIVVMSANGVLKPFLFWTTYYSLEYASISSLTELTRSIPIRLHSVTVTTLPLWLFAAAGFLPLISSSRRGQWFPLAFLAVSCAAILPGGYLYPHYFVLLLPALALLAGMAFTRLQELSAKLPSMAGLAAPISVVLVVGALTVYAGKDYLFRLPPRDVSKLVYGNQLFAEASHKIADHIKANSSSDETVAIFGSEPQIYFYAQREAATRYIHMYSLTDNNPYAALMAEELLADVTFNKPKFIVITYDSLSWLLEPEQIALFLSNIQPLIDASYKMAGYVDFLPNGSLEYVWGNKATHKGVMALNRVYVLERNDRY